MMDAFGISPENQTVSRITLAEHGMTASILTWGPRGRIFDFTGMKSPSSSVFGIFGIFRTISTIRDIMA